MQGKRLLRARNDGSFNNGTLFITDNQPASALYRYVPECNCQLYTFPFQEKPDAKYFLYVQKHGEIHELLTSDDP